MRVLRWRRPRPVECREAVELMAAYLDGVLAGRARARLEAHLAACPHCNEYLAQLQVTIEATGRVEADDLPDAVLDELVGLYRRWLAE